MKILLSECVCSPCDCGISAKNNKRIGEDKSYSSSSIGSRFCLRSIYSWLNYFTDTIITLFLVFMLFLMLYWKWTFYFYFFEIQLALISLMSFLFCFQKRCLLAVTLVCMSFSFEKIKIVRHAWFYTRR